MIKKREDVLYLGSLTIIIIGVIMARSFNSNPIESNIIPLANLKGTEESFKIIDDILDSLSRSEFNISDSNNSNKKSNVQDFNQYQNEQENALNISTLNYKGLTFSYNDLWNISKRVLQDNTAFQVNCERKGFNNTGISINWVRMIVSPKNRIENIVETMKEDPNYMNLSFGTINNLQCNGEDRLYVDCSFVFYGQRIYGRTTSFNSNNNTILVVKQSDIKEKLDDEFVIIEESLNID
jgi:hypothetical protein